MLNVCLICSALLIVKVMFVITVFFSFFYVFLPFWRIKVIINYIAVLYSNHYDTVRESSEATHHRQQERHDGHCVQAE